MNFEATKWIFSQVLLDEEEMRSLLNSLPPFFLFLTGSVTQIGTEEVPLSAFLEAYSAYVASIKEGRPFERTALFSSVFTTTKEALFSLPVDEERHLLRVRSPVIQLQQHRLSYSEADGKFRSMTFGSDTISWGIQFGYPGLYRDPETGEPQSTAQLPNTALFKALQQWVRHNTVPTPFIVGDKRINVPQRLGKRCLSWIHTHRDLVRKHIGVAQ